MTSFEPQESYAEFLSQSQKLVKVVEELEREQIEMNAFSIQKELEEWSAFKEMHEKFQSMVHTFRNHEQTHRAEAIT